MMAGKEVKAVGEGRFSSYRYNAFLMFGFGIAFSVVLVVYALNDAYNSAHREFDLEASSLRNTISRDLTSVDRAIADIVDFVGSSKQLDKAGFTRFADIILDRRQYLHAVSLYTLEPGENQAEQQPNLIFRTGRNEAVVTNDLSDLWPQLQYAESVGDAVGRGFAAPARYSEDPGYETEFLIVQPVEYASNAVTDRPSNSGLVVIEASLRRLLGQTGLLGVLSVNLYSETTGLAGRRNLFEHRAVPKADRHWLLETFDATHAMNFPRYSVRVDISKELYWADLRKELIYTALFLGFAVTLLIVALARSREQQANELRDRNIAIERQVTEQTAELADARDQALDAARAKSEFLSSMSHEIRTPLNAIIGMAELLADTPTNREQSHYIDVFRRAGDRLLGLVNDILDLSKIEAGQLVLEDASIDLEAVLDDVAEIHAMRAVEKGLELVVHVEPDVPAAMRGDPARLRQIVLNLVGNAIKFTDSGEVVIRAEQTSTGEGILIAVTDTGVGIPEEKLESIFENFSQVDSSTTRRYGGTGLGLSISRRLVEIMQGDIWAESVPGTGSSFCFTIPLKTAQPPVADVSASNLDGLRVLVIDDHKASRVAIEAKLKACAAEVLAMPDGLKGVAELEQARQDGHPWQVVLLDIDMPVMDGFETAKAIVSGQHDVDIIGMVNPGEHDIGRDKNRDSGIGAWIFKPVRRAQLIACLSPDLDNAKAVDTVANSPLERPVTEDSRSRILLVEDTADNRLLVKAFLKKQPLDIDEAENGMLGVEMFKAGSYDLVLMDVQMPVLDGYAATRAIRKWEQQTGVSPTPVIALTAHAIREDVEASHAAGCDDHLTKPIKKATLLSALAEYLGDIIVP